MDRFGQVWLVENQPVNAWPGLPGEARSIVPGVEGCECRVGWAAARLGKAIARDWSQLCYGRVRASAHPHGLFSGQVVC
jgi:hypothetical protein